MRRLISESVAKAPHATARTTVTFGGAEWLYSHPLHDPAARDAVPERRMTDADNSMALGEVISTRANGKTERKNPMRIMNPPDNSTDRVALDNGFPMATPTKRGRRSRRKSRSVAFHP